MFSGSIMKFKSVSALAALLLSASAVGAGVRVPAPDPSQGDGRVSAFYTWQGDIPAQAGKLLRTEPQPQQVGLPAATRQLRILYTSTDGLDGKTPVVVSGSVFFPKGTPPKDGWPVVAWGHGTVGLADICAPSWQGRSYRDIRYLTTWLNEGFAIVATDYQGLGVPGPHPLINVPMLAYSILDSARAAIQGIPGLSNKVIIVGQSQGGAGAFAASAYAATYAPELGVKGSVATGVIYRPTDPAKAIAAAPRNPHLVDDALSYGFYGFVVDQQKDPSLKAEDVFTDLALPLVEQARSSCLPTLMGDVVGNGLTAANSRKADPGEAYRQYQAKAPERAARYQTFPTLTIGHPVFIGTGAEDVTPAAVTQLALIRDACNAGTVVEGHLYVGHGHSATVNRSLKDSIPFAKKAIAGLPITPICSPVIE